MIHLARLSYDGMGLAVAHVHPEKVLCAFFEEKRRTAGTRSVHASTEVWREAWHRASLPRAIVIWWDARNISGNHLWFLLI